MPNKHKINIHLLVDKSSPRLRYVLSLIENWTSVHFEVIRSENEITDNIIINYSSQKRNSSAFRIPNHSLLSEDSIDKNPKIHYKNINNKKYLFYEHEGGYDLSFDIFSAIFYLITRYEEYTTSTRDAHNRFPSSASIASRKGFLDIPIIDFWIMEFMQAINAHYNTQIAFSTAFQLLPTVDIDAAWAFQHKPFVRNILGLARDFIKGETALASARYRTLTHKINDPFDSFAQINEILEEHNPIYFILMRNEGEYDKANLGHPAFDILIKSISDDYNIGMHPSYASNDSEEKLREEKLLLEKIIDKEITKSRQHFIKLTHPNSFRSLIKLGITDDYSMGYPDTIGFRAGTSKPFNWYDLENEVSTDLRIHSFCIMDVSLKDYLHYTPAEAIEESKAMINNIKKTSGTACIIWHNSSFSDAHGWADWDEVLESIIKYAAHNADKE